jgi:hypothetical protein
MDPDPFSTEGEPEESNPFGAAALTDGTVLVADAAGNDLLRVWPNGQVAGVPRSPYTAVTRATRTAA